MKPCLATSVAEAQQALDHRLELSLDGVDTFTFMWGVEAAAPSALTEDSVFAYPLPVE